ncbi:MAG: PAS domain S-box protein [Chloroflexi bacterium]|nr:PAS domain S-box protein [Chloroflexota bacterium]
MTKRMLSIQGEDQPESQDSGWSFHDLADFLPDAIIILNKALMIVFLNSVAREMFGYQESELIGQNLDLLLPEKYLAIHQEHLSKFFTDSGGIRRMGGDRVVYGKHHSGYLIPLDISINKRSYRSQDFAICVLRNISEKLANKKALNETEQRYRGMIDSQHTLVVRVDAEGRFVFANQAYCTMFGKNLDELIGSSFTPSVHPDELPLTLEAMKDLERPPYRINITQRAMTMRGWRWIAWEDSVIHDSSKNLYEIQAVGVDVTETKRVEEELSNKIALLSGLFNSIPDIVFFKDAQGIYLGANQEFARLVGKSVDEIVNKSDYDLFAPEIADFFRENDRMMVEQGKQRHNEEWIKYPDGQQVLLDTLKAPLYDSYGQTIGVLGISRDITARKKMEEIAIVERNLAIILAQKSTIADALPLVLDLALHVSDMDCGGIYLVDRPSRDLVLMTHKGLSDAFVDRANKYKAGSGQHNIVMSGNSIYQPYLHVPTIKNEIALNEGLHISAIVPIQFNGDVIACMNVASHTLDDMPDYRRNALENLAFQIGNMLARFHVQAELFESQAELQSMFDSLMDYVFVLDDHGIIIQVNQKVLDSLCYSRDELLGKSVLEVHPYEQRAHAWQIVQDMLAGLIDACPLELIKKDGTHIPVETKVAHGRWGSQDVLIGVSRDITDRKAAEEMIRESVQEIESFFDVSLDLLCIADLQGNVLRLNKAWESTLGYSTDSLSQRNLLEFVHPDDLQASIEEMKRLGAGQKILNYVNRYRCEDGSWRYIEWRAQADGNRVYAAARDITERKAAEDARLEQTKLLEYRQKFEETLTSISTRFINLPPSEISPEINNVLKQIGEFEQVDRSYVFLLDYGSASMTNTHEWCAPGIESQIDNLKGLPTSLFPWWMKKLEQLEEVYIPIASQLPDEALAEREILESQSIQSVLVVPLVSHNSLVGFLGFDSVLRQRFWSPDSILLVKMVGDILSNSFMRIKMQTELLMSEIRNTALLSAVPDLIFRIHRDGTFLDYKASSVDLLAIPAEQVVGSSLQSFMPYPLHDEAMVCIQQALESKEIQTMEYILKIGDSSHTFEARFKDSGTDEVTAIVRDISDRARLEQMKSDFINRATHELRTPIATMLLMVNLIDGGTTQEEYSEYWDVLKSELGRERLLVEDLLTAGRLESNQANLHFRYIDLGEVMKKVIHQIEMPVREKDIILTHHFMEDLDETSHVINADENALTQVFINLLGNAVKFTPHGGKVDVSMDRQLDGIEITITDSGIGIPSEDIPMLFNRFFRGTNAIEDEIPGTGIGLFIVRSILEKHGGTIKVHSELGKGSQFIIWLPFDH